MADPLLGAFARALMSQDLLATVAVPAGYDARAYCRELIHRFENPALGHRTQQIAMDGTQKVPVRWLPALRESVAAGVERPFLERALAAWLHYLAAGRNDAGEELTVSDPGAAALSLQLHTAGNEHDTVAAALAFNSVFGREPWPDAFAHRIATYLAQLRRGGTTALLAPTSAR
jgi:fructuronate reductase